MCVGGVRRRVHELCVGGVQRGQPVIIRCYLFAFRKVFQRMMSKDLTEEDREEVLVEEGEDAAVGEEATDRIVEEGVGLEVVGVATIGTKAILKKIVRITKKR